LLFFSVLLFTSANTVFSVNATNLSLKKHQTEIQQENSILKKKPSISDKTISEIKKSQILLLIIITFFVFGFLFLIYHLKKVKIINQKLEHYSKENQFLLSETNHRVNNNLQLISLLIAETLRKKHTAENKLDFEKLLSKVQTIASLHRHLYLTKKNTEINLKNYLLEVKNNFNDFAQEKNINISFDIDVVEINPDDAMYLGLLITELIINSVKHAFDENQEKNIDLYLAFKEVTNEINFEYSDNGILLKGGKINPVLVNQLCQQLAVNPKLNTENGFNLKFLKKLKSNV